MRLLFCFLLAVWATVSSALSVASPAPNSTLPIGEMFSVAWTYTQVADASNRVTVSLLSGPSQAEVVAILFTDIPEQFNSWPATVDQATPNTEYYLFLNDDTSPGVIAGPYYFKNSAPSPASSPSNGIPAWLIAVIVIAVLLKISFWTCCLWRCGCLPCCPAPRRRGLQSSKLPKQYQPDVSEMTITGYNQPICSRDEKSHAQESLTLPQENTTIYNSPSPSVPQLTADEHV